MYNHLGEYNQAKELHEKVVTISKMIFVEDHADVATSYKSESMQKSTKVADSW